MKTEVAQLKRQFYHKQNEVNRNFHVLHKSWSSSSDFDGRISSPWF